MLCYQRWWNKVSYISLSRQCRLSSTQYSTQYSAACHLAITTFTFKSEHCHSEKKYSTRRLRRQIYREIQRSQVVLILAHGEQTRKRDNYRRLFEGLINKWRRHATHWQTEHSCNDYFLCAPHTHDALASPARTAQARPVTSQSQFIQWQSTAPPRSIIVCHTWHLAPWSWDHYGTYNSHTPATSLLTAVFRWIWVCRLTFWFSHSTCSERATPRISGTTGMQRFIIRPTVSENWSQWRRQSGATFTCEGGTEPYMELFVADKKWLEIIHWTRSM